MTVRKFEIFSAGCSVCNELIEQVREAACDSCEVTVLDMSDAGVAARAKELGVGSLPAVAIDGKLASCCAGRGADLAQLREAGLGQALG